jgi:hypothetical protein
MVQFIPLYLISLEAVGFAALAPFRIPFLSLIHAVAYIASGPISLVPNLIPLSLSVRFQFLRLHLRETRVLIRFPFLIRV